MVKINEKEEEPYPITIPDWITYLGNKSSTKQSRHSGYKVLTGYIQLSEEHTREAYMKGISPKQQDIQPEPETPEQDTIHQPEIKPDIPRPEPQIQRQETNPTDKYIQLLKDGLIDKSDFLKLMSGNKMETDGYIY